MTKADLVEEICKRSRLSKSENSRIVDEILNSIAQALSEGHHIEIRGFGTFKVRARRSRRARNPRTGAEVNVPAKLVPVFKPSNQLKSVVRGDAQPPADWREGGTSQRSEAGTQSENPPPGDSDTDRSQSI
jgi:integration host factor subunit beta